MNSPHLFPVDPALDLVLERTAPVSPDLVWKAWTTPELLVQWFCPKPWSVSECDIDLRPGGRFFTVMQSPEGEKYPGESCYLEVVPGRRLVWTSAMDPGFRPKLPTDNDSGTDSFFFTAIIEMEPTETGCSYRATVKHAFPADREKHEAMGFHDGWGTVFDQLVELMSNRA